MICQDLLSRKLKTSKGDFDSRIDLKVTADEIPF
jgi:hypothetical protein